MPASLPSRRRSLRPGIDVARWIAVVVVTGVLAILLIPVGVFAGAMGLSALSLAVLTMLAALVAWRWRRATLAVAVVAFGLAAGTIAGASSKERIARSVGPQVVAPTGPLRALDGRSYHQGLGRLVVDLRQVQIQPGTTTRLTLRSDAGAAIVALPREVCIDVSLRVTPLPINAAVSELSNWTSSASLGSFGFDEWVSSPWPAADLFGIDHPDDLRHLERLGYSAARADSAFLSSRGAIGPSQLFGVAPSRIATDASTQAQWRRAEYEPWSVTRRTRDPRAARIELSVAAARQVIVRDYPRSQDVETTTGNWADAASWPYVQSEDPAPEAFANPVRWRARWADDPHGRKATSVWAAWERDTVRTLARLARQGAGSCATRSALANEWRIVRFGSAGTEPDGTLQRLIAVNGLGELVVRPAGAPIANGTDVELARATNTTALTASEAAARDREYAAATFGVAR